MLLDALRRHMSEDSLSGMATKRQRMEESTPLKYFLRSILEGKIRQQLAQSTQMPYLGAEPRPTVEPPSVNPLENAIMRGRNRGMPKSL